MTLLEKFKKDHPNAPMLKNGNPKCCPFHLGYTEEVGCTVGNCTRCWDRKYEGEDEPVETAETCKDENIADKIADVRNGLIDRAFNEAYAERIIMNLIDRGYFDK